MSLWADFLGHEGRVVHKWKHYFPAYEQHFSRYVGRPVVFLEIGCGEGGSLELWRRYFGPHARIVGVDIRPECKAFEGDQIEVRIGDQSNEAFLAGLLAEFGTPDVVLDDGSHEMAHVTESFRYLYPRTARDGVYMVEDMHTAYWDEYGGGLRREGSFIELCKGLVDELNADWTRDALPPTDFTRTTLSMHFYDSIVAFERGAHTRKFAPQIGAGPATKEVPMTEPPRQRRFWPLFRSAAGSLKFLPLLLPFLTGCGGGAPGTPQAACEARANHDPAVEQLVMLNATRESLVGENREALKRARDAAVLRCLRDKGLAPPGGVELPTLHR